MPAFQIVTTNGDTFTDGDRTTFQFLGVHATLQDYDHSGDYVVLQYSDGITESIPEVHIRSIVNARPDASS